MFSYDYESDTLMVHLYGRGIPGVSVPVAGGWMLPLTSSRDKVIGIHIEGVLAREVREHPRLLNVLDAAELRGITPDEIDQVRREIAAPAPREAVRIVAEEFPTLALAGD